MVWKWKFFVESKDYGFEEKWEKDCPDIMDKPYEEDNFSDSDSDEHHSIELEVLCWWNKVII